MVNYLLPGWSKLKKLEPNERFLALVYGLRDINDFNHFEQKHFWNQLLNDVIIKIISSKIFTEREKVVFNKRIMNGQTLKDVGLQMNCTPERVRQIESKFLRKVRHPSRRKPLDKFIKNNIFLEKK